MSARTLLLLSALSGLLLPADGARAQSEATASPGVYHQGRFLGFVPAHQRRGANSDASRTRAPVQKQELDAADSGQVKRASTTLPDAVVPDLPEIVETDSGVGCAESPCCQQPHLWARGEFLLWWMNGMDTPALATTSPNGTPQAQAGVLGQPGTGILFGNSEVNDDARPGARVTLGLWFDPCECRGLDVSYLTLGNDGDSFTGSNDDFAILARPFFNVQNNAQDARRIVFPGELQGTLAISTATELQAFEAVYRCAATRAPCLRMDLLLGYRFAELIDRVRIDESTSVLAGPLAGTTFDLFDQFGTRNTFHGGELGFAMEWQNHPCWSCEAVAKVALGQTNSRATVLGQTTTTVNGVAATNVGGLLAQPTNIGTFEQSEFSAIWEIALTLRRQIHCRWTASLGYSFLLWTDVARAGEQIDIGINPTQIPPGVLVGAARPAFSFATSSFWAQGLHVGLEYAY